MAKVSELEALPGPGLRHTDEKRPLQRPPERKAAVRPRFSGAVQHCMVHVFPSLQSSVPCSKVSSQAKDGKVGGWVVDALDGTDAPLHTLSSKSRWGSFGLSALATQALLVHFGPPPSAPPTA